MFVLVDPVDPVLIVVPVQVEKSEEGGIGLVAGTESSPTLAATMFSLFCGAWQYISSKPQFNVAILGLDDAGKTVRGDLVRNVC